MVLYIHIQTHAVVRAAVCPLISRGQRGLAFLHTAVWNTRMINVLARQHTSYSKSLLGHMSDQTVVWVYCPMARHGQCVTKRQEKGREEVRIPQVCECQWFVRSHPHAQTVKRTNAPVHCCETVQATVCNSLLSISFLHNFLFYFKARWVISCFFDRRTGHTDIALKLRGKKATVMTNCISDRYSAPRKWKKSEKPQSG